MRRIRNPKIFFPILILVLLLAAFAFNSLRASPGVQGASTQNPTVSEEPQTTDLNREFLFSITDNSGKEITKIKYLVQSAEKTREIVVGGQKATAVTGKTFLIINLKITNESAKNTSLNTRDFIRLKVNGQAEFLAPEIHNDPVEVLAISTKYTRVGYTINNTDQAINLSIGEIIQNKTDIPLSFN